MCTVLPGALTEPVVEGMVEAGVFFTASLSLEWYPILDCWLPIHFDNRYNRALTVGWLNSNTTFVSQPGESDVNLGATVQCE